MIENKERNNNNQIIFLSESEKDADNLTRLGLLCVSSGGAESWRPEFAEPLKGRQVCILPHNDPAGRRYAETAAKSLCGKAASIRVVDPSIFGTAKGADVSDWIERNGGTDTETLQDCKSAFLKLVDTAPEYQPPASLQATAEPATDDTEPQKARGERGANLLFNNLTSDLNFRLCRNNTGEAFAIINNDPVNIQGQEFRDFLCYRFLKDTGQPLRKEAMNTVIMASCAQARYEGELIDTPLRVAKKNGTIFYDLGKNQDGSRVVEITPDGWRILVNESPIYFRRSSWQKPQVCPEKSGDPWKLFEHCNIAESDRLLVLVTVIAALVPGISHPAMQLHGPQGSGKSFFAKLIKGIIDPSASMLLALPPKEEDVLLSFYRHYIAILDNISKLSIYLTEITCSFISGGYIEKRTLHTTLDSTIVPIDCIPIFTSINSSLHERPDLSERTLKIGMEHITKKQRLRETVLLENFKNDIPGILGGMLDTLSKAMRIYPDVQLSDLPRMADWFTWGFAIADALGEGLGNQFASDYFKSMGLQTEDLLDDNALLSAIVSRMETQISITGNFKEVLTLLREEAQPSDKDRSFPLSPRNFRRHLERIKVPLQELGITYHIKGKTSKGRLLEFVKNDAASAVDTQTSPAGDGELPF